MEKYQEIFNRSLEEPDAFWAEAAESIDWHKKWDTVLDSSNPPFYRWFRGGELNTCYNAVDRHVENGRGEQTAIIYDSPATEPADCVPYTVGTTGTIPQQNGNRHIW